MMFWKLKKNNILSVAS